MLGLNAVFPKSRNASVPSLASRLPSPILQPAPAALTGAGNRDFITMQAINAMNPVDVFFIPDKALRKLISAAPAVSEVLRPSLKALKIELLVISAPVQGCSAIRFRPWRDPSAVREHPQKVRRLWGVGSAKAQRQGPGAH
jgi:hypothetical protein